MLDIFAQKGKHNNQSADDWGQVKKITALDSAGGESRKCLGVGFGKKIFALFLLFFCYIHHSPYHCTNI